MQKINRKQLSKDVADFDFTHDIKNFGDCQPTITVKEAQRLRNYASILLELTDPEFVPSEGMMISGENAASMGMLDDYADIFRAMMREVYDGK